MLFKNKFSFPLILFFSIYLFFCLNWNFVESKNLESRKLEILKTKKFLNKGGSKFNFNKTEKLNSRKLLNIKLNGEDEFFVDFAMIIYDDVFNTGDYEIFGYSKFCYDREKYFKKYCDLNQMSKPINATFDEDKLDKMDIFLDEIVNSKGEAIINVGKRTELSLDFKNYSIRGNSENIESIAKALNAQFDKEKNEYYLNGNCTDFISKVEANIGLKFKNFNTTISVSGRDLAAYGYNHKCIIWLVTEEESPLTFSVQILADYCVLFDAVLNQVAFAPRVAKSKDMEWIECWKEG